MGGHQNQIYGVTVLSACAMVKGVFKHEHSLEAVASPWSAFCTFKGWV